ncbi:MAG: M48 family metalloprotease, partial [Archangium sp.]|nr:M48 family metalloprotease [Archangium sp.]
MALLSVGTSGCALLSKVPGGNVVNNVGGEGAQIISDAQAAAKAKCDPIRKAEVPWTEERAMGGVVAVKQASNFGSYFLDGMTATKPGPLAEEAKAKKVSLPDGPKNDLTAYLAVVGRNLAKYSTRPDISWTFGVIENETPNAVSAPGGYVIVTTGLLKKIKNEAQLAGVIGHEIGHIIHKHSLKRYRDQKATQCDLATFGGTVVKKGVQAALALLPADAKAAARFADKFDNFDLDNSEGDFVRFVMDAVMKIMDALGNEKEDEFQADATAL